MYTDKQVIVFGAAGFIGFHLLQALVVEDIKEIVCVDVNKPQFTITDPKLRWVKRDCTDPIELDGIDSSSLLINLIGLRTFPGFPDEDYFHTNLGSTRQIIKFAKEKGIEKIIFTSTMAVYPTGSSPKSESAVLRPESAYGESKLRGEELLTAWCNSDSRHQLLICRPAVIFGYRDNGNFTRLARALKWKFFFYAGRSNTIKSCGYVKDLVRSFFHFDSYYLAGKKIITYNFAYEERITIKQICDSFCAVGNFRFHHLTVPKKLLLFAGLIGDFFKKLGLDTGISVGRVEKLDNDTNIIPQVLSDAKFNWSFSLDEALLDWRRHDGRFH